MSQIEPLDRSHYESNVLLTKIAGVRVLYTTPKSTHQLGCFDHQLHVLHARQNWNQPTIKLTVPPFSPDATEGLASISRVNPDVQQPSDLRGCTLGR